MQYPSEGQSQHDPKTNFLWALDSGAARWGGPASSFDCALLASPPLGCPDHPSFSCQSC